MEFSVLNRKGQKIIGVVSIPEQPVGLAFVQHGLGGFKDQPNTLAMADTFFTSGYTVVNFDTTNSFGESDGEYKNATMQLHYEDLVDVISWAKTQEWYVEPFVLAGHSLGGYTVARYAEEYPNEVRAVFPFALVVAGELSWEAAKRKGELDKWKETGWRIEESASRPGTFKELPWSHMEERLKHDLRPNASRLAMPVLFVTGENDSSCLPEHQKMFFDLVPGRKEFHIIPGARHTFREQEHIQQLKEILSSWIKTI